MIPKAYESISDEELIEMYRDGDREVSNFLCNKYKNLVRSLASTMFILGAETEDLIQEGMIGLFSAIQDFDSGRDTKFSTFANLCVLRQMYKAIQKAGRLKSMPLNNYVSLYNEDGEESQEFVINGTNLFNPEELLLGQEAIERLENRIEEELSPLEKQVLELHLTGLGYIEIAKVLNREEKSTDNALQRIRSKIKKIINEER